MRLAAAALAILLALAPAPAFPQTAAPAATDPPPTLFVIRYRPGPAWLPGRPVLQQNLREHGAYIGRLLAEGRLFAAGPFTDADGGMAMLRVSSRAEAEAILAADPAQRDGIMIGEISGWVPYFDSRQPLRRAD